MAGLRKLCKMFGSLTVKDADGHEVRYVWDYARDEPVTREQMPEGGERDKLSERAKWLRHPPRSALQCAARACPGCTVCNPDTP